MKHLGWQNKRLQRRHCGERCEVCVIGCPHLLHLGAIELPIAAVSPKVSPNVTAKLPPRVWPGHHVKGGSAGSWARLSPSPRVWPAAAPSVMRIHYLLQR